MRAVNRIHELYLSLHSLVEPIHCNIATITSRHSPILFQTFNARIASHFVPAANTTYDLGTSSLRWNDLYLDGSTINLGGASISSDGTVITLPSDSKIGTDKIPTADSATGIVTRTVPLFTKAGGLSSAALQLKMKASGPTDIVFTAFTKSNGNSITTQERAFFSF